ncbi:hypothetical protein [Ferrovibrio terrae]|uniref:type IV toxin-antitoxin system AbiEi family antitoxin domain-containing protein n=1 Tax=Ferrovibrio terrae TaxID=2594003 RepID=UPI003137B6F1
MSKTSSEYRGHGSQQRKAVGLGQIRPIVRPNTTPTDASTGPKRPVARHHRETILNILAKRQGPVKWTEFRQARVESTAMRDMVREGTVIHPTPGVFALQREYEPLPFALSVLRAHGTEYFLSLTSAARYHGLIPEIDSFLWVVMPDNRNTLHEVAGFFPVPVRWRQMHLPSEPFTLSDGQRLSVGWTPGMSREESTERFLGVYREWIYGAEVKITSPARTICDLLMFRNRPIGRVGLEGLFIEDSIAFSAVAEYARNFEMASALTMAERLGYGDRVTSSLRIASHMLETPAPRL